MDGGKIEESHAHHVQNRGRNFVMRELVVSRRSLAGSEVFHLESPWDFTTVLPLMSSDAFIRRLHLLLLSFCKRLLNYSNLVSMKFSLIGSLIVEMTLSK